MPRPPKLDSIADIHAAPAGAAAVDKAMSLLAAFRCGDATLALSELAERTKLYKSTVLRALASLEHAGMVQRMADGRYALGSEIARLHAVYRASFSLDRLVTPVLEALVRLTGESAAYHVRQGDARLCLYRVDSPQPVRDHVRAGELLPLFRGTGGRILVAFDAALIKTAPVADKALYQQIVADGFYAAAGDRLAEVAGVSAPVFSQDGRIAGALTLTMPVHRYHEAYNRQVVAAAAELSGKLPSA